MKNLYLKSILLFICLSFPVLAKTYKGAEFRTKAAYTYGRFEVRYKATEGGGQTATFFTYHELESGIGDWNEIDIEILGRYHDDVQFNTITPGQTNHVHHQYVPFDPAVDFHTYAFEWTPAYVAWFIDDAEVYRQTGTHIATLNKAQKIMMNIWISGASTWVGEFNPKILPLFAYYDWVSYASYMPGSGTVGTNNDFSLEWKDDFLIWDQNRWSKATHTFSGNMVDFMAENVTFQNGEMILCLTDETNLGYVDHQAPFVEWARYADDTVSVRFSEEVEQTSAEKKGNYYISNILIESASLEMDKRTVRLSVDSVDSTQPNTLYVLGVKDRSSSANSLIGQAAPIQNPPVWTFPIKVNIGGIATGAYLADQKWSGLVNYGHDGGNSGSFPGMAIDGTDDDEVFRTECWEPVKYQVRLPNGKYKVTLLMAENYFGETGKRVFDIHIEGKYIARNVDIFQSVGNHRAYSLTIDEVMVSDRMLDVHFGAVADVPILNGIIIEPVASGIGNGASELPGAFRLRQNFPNPFNQATMILYDIAETADVSLRVFDLLGDELEFWTNHAQSAGAYCIFWTPALSSGIYFCQLEAVTAAEKFRSVRKMVLIK